MKKSERTKPTVKFECSDKLKKEIDQYFENSEFSVTVVGRALFDFWLHLCEGDREKIIGLHQIYEGLRNFPDALERYRSEHGQELSVVIPRLSGEIQTNSDDQNDGQ